MWFYSLHLKSKGLSWNAWSFITRKLLLPYVSWTDIKTLLLLLPHCKWTDKAGSSWFAFLWSILLRDNYPVVPSHKPESSEVPTPRKQGRQPSVVMTAMAALATLSAPAPFQLASDAQLRRSLTRYKHPLGGLNTNKLSLSTAKSSPHQALLTQLQNNEQEFRDILNPDLNLPIHSAVIDSGASFTSINNKDLVAEGTMVRLEQPIMLDGIAGGITVEYKCDIKFDCIDKDGNSFPCQTEAYYHDQLPCMLLSPQAFLNTQHLQKLGQQDIQSLVEDHFTIYRNRVEWHAEGKHLLTVPYDQSFLPRMQLFPSGQAVSTLKAFHMSVLHGSNKNLTALQKIWLKLHHKLGHPSFSLIQQMASGGYFSTQALGLSQLKLTDAPMCKACKYGKQVRRPDGTTTTTKNPDVIGSTKEGQTIPGMRIFSDQIISFQPGRLFHTAGCESNKDKFNGATIFVDAASGLIFVVPQVTMNATDTINAKHEFERYCHEMGVTVDSYHTDNGIYKSKAFTEELVNNFQSIRFSGVGAKWQNGAAEGAIRILVSKARTMMIHAAIHWPDAKDESLWPMALAHAAYVYNHTPNATSGIAPMEIFSRTQGDGQALRNLHTWGCPTYVLEPKLTEAGGKIPKWKPRSRRGQYMGNSPVHADTIALIRNLKTGYISPQYHVVFDDSFEMVYADEDTTPDAWENLCIFNKFQAEFEQSVTPPKLSAEWLSPEELASDKSRQESCNGRRLYQDMHSKEIAEDLKYKAPISSSPAVHPPQTRETPLDPRQTRETEHWIQSLLTPLPSQETTSPQPTVSPSPLPRRNPTRHAPREPLNISSVSGQSYDKPKSSTHYASAFAAALALSSASTTQLFHHQLTGFDSYSGLQEYMHPVTLQSPFYLANPMALKAKKVADPDIPSTREALTGPHAEQHWASMSTEIESLESKRTWDVVLRSSMPKGIKAIPGTWCHRIKRHPDGSLNKFKARWCFRGDLERDTYDGNPYSPLVGWPTVRAALLLAATHNWTSRQVDFTLAFCQSPQQRPVYMELPQYFRPKGYEGQDVVLKLNKSIYGQMDSPKLFYEHLCKGMHKLGFENSESDPCLFIHKTEKIMVLNYCDDQIWLSPDNALIERYVTKLKNLGYDLSIEDKGDNMFGFLGIEIKRAGSSIEMTQTGLINKVISYCGMNNGTTRTTPAAADPLGSDLTGKPFSEEWSYPAVVGMLLYLASNTRPDIQFAVHQVARFSHCPKRSHAQAVKRIIRYLIGTREQGTIFHPDLNEGLNCYVDADFAGLWGREDEQDPVSVKSRTGFTLTLFGCPIIWQSKLQAEITLSSTAAEYVAFSMAMREVLPMRALLQEIGTKLGLSFLQTSLVRSTVFEDNMGCLSLVNVPKMSPRNKYLALKYHFFRSQIGESKGIVAKYVNTKEQKADIFTKGLPEAQFQHIRKLLIGW